LRAGGEVIGALSLAVRDPRLWRPAERELVEALTALTAQALERVLARQAERQAMEATRSLSESLQRSLLTEPPQAGGLQIAVRYQPAAHEAQVGGDWYDAFGTPSGSTTLVIGDVAGHDRHAAAGMAQVRNVLRGVAQLVPEPPAAVLRALDRALHGLDVEVLATAVLCEVRESSTDGALLLRWSNAGHPPPVLLTPDGTARLLATEPEMLLGLGPDADRSDHEVELPPGSMLVLYTDGLVERRDEALDVGLERLRRVAEQLHELPPEARPDAMLDRLGRDADDDVALLVLNVPGAGQPRER
jgi:serine phosphatase RsbU (regulator of sigma subunit)